jgi:glyoxylase-like metal-dependent hydrolase (beta-lactamase superfamily II)
VPDQPPTPEANPAPLLLPADPVAADFAEGSIFFVGNATVLIRFAGFAILTDPSFIHKHEQTWLGYGLHTTRLTDPACGLADLPPLDFVLLSHFHGDHFDQAAEDGLDKKLPIVTVRQSAGRWRRAASPTRCRSTSGRRRRFARARPNCGSPRCRPATGR